MSSRSTRTSAADRRGQRGTSIIELTITVGLVLVVIGVMLDSLASAQRGERYASDRSVALDEMRSAMARFTKDLRQASGIDEGATAATLQADTYVQGTAAHVVYAASGGVLTRQVNSSPAEVLIDDLVTDDVFAYDPGVDSAEVVVVRLEVRPPTSPDTTIELTSEVRMRNRSSA